MGVRPELVICLFNSDENMESASALKEMTKKYYCCGWNYQSLSSSLGLLYSLSSYPYNKLQRGSQAAYEAVESLLKLDFRDETASNLQDKVLEIENVFKERYMRACSFEFPNLVKIVQVLQRKGIFDFKKVVDSQGYEDDSPIISFNFPGWVPGLSSRDLNQSERYAFDKFIDEFGYGKCKLLLADRSLEDRTLEQFKDELCAKYRVFACWIYLSAPVTSG